MRTSGCPETPSTDISVSPSGVSLHCHIHRITRYRDHVGRVLGRRCQRGMEAVVVALIHDLLQRQARRLHGAGWSETYIRIGTPGGISISSRLMPASMGMRVEEFWIASRSTSGFM